MRVKAMRALLIAAMLLMPAFTTAAPPRRLGTTSVPGRFYAWVAGKRQMAAGPMKLTIDPVAEGELVAPRITIAAPGLATHSLTGEARSKGVEHRFGYGSLTMGSALPGVVLQSDTGGGHCCIRVQAAFVIGGQWRTVDMGEWDGDWMASFPRDLSGDGNADFVMRDDRFLDAFASHAGSYAPPQVLSIRNGQRVDVSREPAFASIYAADLKTTRAQCLAVRPNSRNGACAAYAADAARLGRFDPAWREILAHYDRIDGWALPTGCRVALGQEEDCPEGQTITYPNYPAALRAFLVRTGYLAR